METTLKMDVGGAMSECSVHREIEGLWTIKDAAAFLRKSVRWVFYALRKPESDIGSLPSVKLGKTPRFVPDDLRAWVEMGCPPSKTFRAWKETASRKRKSL